MPITSIHCSTYAEAAQVLGSNPRARFHAGGTLVMRAINEGDQSFDTLVRVAEPLMTSVQTQGQQLLLGASVTMGNIIANPDCSFLHSVARSVGGPAIRNMATVGGNLFAPSPYGDIATALLALDAELRFSDGASMPLLEWLDERATSVASAATANGTDSSRSYGAANTNTATDAQRLITQIALTRPASADHFRYHKVSRVKPKGISVITIAVHLPRSGSTLNNTRVAYGAMGSTPVRQTSVERALDGQSLESSIESAVKVATEGLNPPTDPIASSWYRLAVAPVHLRRVLLGTHAGEH